MACNRAQEGHLQGCCWHSRVQAASLTINEALPRLETLPMTFRPLADRVAVRRVDEEAKTKGGIIIPDTAKEKPQEGEVIAIVP